MVAWEQRNLAYGIEALGLSLAAGVAFHETEIDDGSPPA